jgi:uncharacterized protein (TIGR02594 family)
MHPWIEVAFKEWGVKEWEPGSNPAILKYWQVAAPIVHDDDIAWCAAFMTWVMSQAGHPEMASPFPAAWKTMGVESTCVPGALAVTKNASGSSGHVTFVVVVKGDKFLGLGGNQEEEVDLDWMPIANYNFRMPA